MREQNISLLLPVPTAVRLRLVDWTILCAYMYYLCSLTMSKCASPQ